MVWLSTIKTTCYLAHFTVDQKRRNLTDVT